MPSETEKKRPGTSQEKNMFHLWEEGTFRSGSLSNKRKKVCKVFKIWTFCFLLERNHFPLESGKDSQPKRASNGKKRAGRQTNQMGGYSE